MATNASRNNGQYGLTYFSSRLRSSILLRKGLNILYFASHCPRTRGCNFPILCGIFLIAILDSNSVPGERSMKNSVVPKVLVAGLLTIFVCVAAFAQVDVARKTTAITYPLDDTVK